MSFMTKTVLTMVLIGLIVCMVSAETTFTVDQSEIVRAGSGETKDFIITVCGADSPYQVSRSSFTTDDAIESRGMVPELVSSSVNVTHYLNNEDSFYVSTVSGSCDTMTFRTWEGTSVNTYDFYLSMKNGQYFKRSGSKIRISILDPKDIEDEEEKEADDAKVAAMEEKIIEQGQKIVALEALTTTPTPTQTLTPTLTPTLSMINSIESNETMVDSITIPPTYEITPIVTVNETRIAELEAKVASQQLQLDEQKGLIEYILSFFGIE